MKKNTRYLVYSINHPNHREYFAEVRQVKTLNKAKKLYKQAICQGFKSSIDCVRTTKSSLHWVTLIALAN